MEKELILNQAIEKAVKNGWDLKNASYGELRNLPTSTYKLMIDSGVFNIYLFNHNFCKAFWGEEKVKCRDCKTDHGICNPILKHPFYDDCPKIWKIRIQQLAISKDRLEYISKFLK